MDTNAAAAAAMRAGTSAMVEPGCQTSGCGNRTIEKQRPCQHKLCMTCTPATGHICPACKCKRCGDDCIASRTKCGNVICGRCYLLMGNENCPKCDDKMCPLYVSTLHNNRLHRFIFVVFKISKN